MAQKDKEGAHFDLFDGVAQRAAPSRPRTSSGTRLSVPSSPSLAMPNGARRTLAGIGDGSLATPPHAPPPVRSSGALPTTKKAAAPGQQKRHVDVEHDDDDEVTHEFVERTKEEDEDTSDQDKTRELPDVGPPSPAPAAAVAAAPAPARPKATLLGLAAPAAIPPAHPSRPPAIPPPQPQAAPARSARPAAGPAPSYAPAPRAPQAVALARAPAPPSAAVSVSPWGAAAPTAPVPARPGSIPDYAVPIIRMKSGTPTIPPRLGSFTSHVAAALAGGVVLVLLVAVRPSQGRILVNASDSRGGSVNRLSVFVDGEKTPCATAPCYLSYEAGTHEVKVIADGFEVPATQAVAVKSGDSVTANFTLGASSGSAGIKVSGVQAGVKLFIDDKEIGPLPQVVRDVVPGSHIIRVAGSERYLPIERRLTVERDKMEDLGSITLKVLKGNVTVRPGTPGARVFISSGSDRRELPVLPISLDIDTTKAWSLEATKSGYDSYRQPIAFDDGVAEKTYTVTLEPSAGPAPAAPAYEPPPPSYAPSPVSPTPAPPAPRPVAFGAASAAAQGEAFLNINSIPPSTCILDGKTLGLTPRIHVSVTPGSHTVKFRDADDGFTKTVFVNVGAGETKLAVAKLN